MSQLKPEVRPSPAAHASETPVGTIRKGHNGANWIVLSNNKSKEVRRWYELKGKHTISHTQHNGTSMRVVFTGSQLYVFNDKPSLVYKVSGFAKVWKTSSTILVELARNSYVYIGGVKIFAFKTKEPVTAYKSPMGNNYVPYPYAQTATASYLMIEERVIERSGSGDPYKAYYSDADAKSRSHALVTKKIHSEW